MLNNNNKLLEINNQTMIGGKFILKEKIGSGSFGNIYKGINLENHREIAIKIEKYLPNTENTLFKESKILNDMAKINGFPYYYAYGIENKYEYLAMDLLGENLHKLYKLCHQKFSLKTILLIADQILTRIEVLHSKGYIHRDIKPENFCMGTGTNSNILYMIDFGLSRSYRMNNGRHIFYKENQGFVGTARYASINTHLGVEQSRRDDLESIGYLLIYFMKGQLPWQNIKISNKHKRYECIKEMKLRTNVEVLFRDLPHAFCEYLTYVKNLSFMDEPDYKYMRSIFRNLFRKNDFTYDYEYDWIKLYKKHKSTESRYSVNENINIIDENLFKSQVKYNKKSNDNKESGRGREVITNDTKRCLTPSYDNKGIGEEGVIAYDSKRGLDNLDCKSSKRKYDISNANINIRNDNNLTCNSLVNPKMLISGSNLKKSIPDIKILTTKNNSRNNLLHTTICDTEINYLHPCINTNTYTLCMVEDNLHKVNKNSHNKIPDSNNINDSDNSSRYAKTSRIETINPYSKTYITTKVSMDFKPNTTAIEENEMNPMMTVSFENDIKNNNNNMTASKQLAKCRNVDHQSALKIISSNISSDKIQTKPKIHCIKVPQKNQLSEENINEDIMLEWQDGLNLSSLMKDKNMKIHIL